MALILNGTGALSGIADLAIDTNTLYVNSTNDRVGIGTTTPATKLDLVGSNSRYTYNVDNSYTVTTSITPAATAFVTSYNNALQHIFQVSGVDKLTIDSNGYLINNVNSTKSVTVTAKMTAAASSTATYTIDTTTLGIDSNLFYMCEVTAGAYGNSNSGNGIYKGVQNGFSGGSVYQSITNITNTITGGTWTLSGGTNSVTLSLQNTNASQSKFAIMRFEFTWGA